MHPRISISQICFLGQPIEKTGAIWRALGAEQVGLMNYSLLEELPALEDALRLGGHKVSNITHPFLPGGRHPADPFTVARERARLNRVIDLAKELGAPCVYMLTGGRGAATWEECADAFCDAIAPCVQHARAAGVALGIEPAPSVYADLTLSHTLRDTLALAARCDVGLCLEFATIWSEPDLKRLIDAAMPRCVLVQVSDYVYCDRALPSRAVPGDGDLPIMRMLEWILSAGYEGAFDLELIGPRIDKEGRPEAVRRAADKLSEMLVTLGA